MSLVSNASAAFAAAGAAIKACYKPGGADVAVAEGGTGASPAAGARTNLGLGAVDLRDATSIASSGTPSCDVSQYKQLSITGLVVPITSLSSGLSNTNLLGDGWPFVVRIYSAAARAIVLGSLWRPMGVPAPTTTVAGKTMYIAGKWNTADSVIDLLAVGQQP